VLIPVEVTDLPQDADTPKQEASKHPNQDSMWIRSFTIQFRNAVIDMENGLLPGICLVELTITGKARH